MKIGTKIALFFLPVCTLFGDAPDWEISERALSHLHLRDTSRAVELAKDGLKVYPESTRLMKVLLKAHSKRGDEVAAFSLWEKLESELKDGPEKREVLEDLAWGVLEKGALSDLVTVKVHSLMGAAQTKDRRAVSHILDGMKSTNAYVRAMSVHFASQLGDTPLKDQIYKMVESEKIWYVRQELIRAIGQMRLIQAEKMLKTLIASPKTGAEERSLAILALVSMYDSVSTDEVDALIKSDRSGLRGLGVQIISYFDQKDQMGALYELLDDPSSEVRISALNAIGLMGAFYHNQKPLFEQIRPHLSDADPAVAITAAWAINLAGDKEGGVALEKWLDHPTLKWRRLAAAAVKTSGKSGVKIAQKKLKNCDDPYVKMALATELIGQRKQLGVATTAIWSAFDAKNGELWMWESEHNPLFKCMVPSTIPHIDHIPHYPEIVDKSCRLELLSLMHHIDGKKAEEKMKAMLSTRYWQVTGMTAALLLQQADEQSYKMVESLLTDHNEKVRLQAALVLSYLAHDERVVPVLIDAYPKAERNQKIQILEALSQISDERAIPFLVTILSQPQQGLRVVAASAIINAIYR